MVSLIQGLTPKHLKMAIDNNISLWQCLPEKTRQDWRSKARPHQDKLKLLNTANIGKALARRRPDLWHVIVTTPQGPDWLSKLLEEIRRDLAGLDTMAMPQVK